MMKLPYLATVLMLIAGTVRSSAGDAWSTDYAASTKLATETKCDLLIEFTGSDWCAPCSILRKEVLSKEQFQQGVKGKFVLVELDYPRAQGKQSPELARQNEKLKSYYGVSAYPTVVLADAQGLPYAAVVGYPGEGIDSYLAQLEGLREKRQARDRALAEARAAKDGPERAKRLTAAITDLAGGGLSESMLFSTYRDVIGEIRNADPEGSRELMKKVESQLAYSEFSAGLSAFLFPPGTTMTPAIKDVSGALKHADTYIASGKLVASDLAELKCFRAWDLLARTDIDAAIASLKDIDESALDDAGKAKVGRVRKLLEQRRAAQATGAAEGGKK